MNGIIFLVGWTNQWNSHFYHVDRSVSGAAYDEIVLDHNVYGIGDEGYSKQVGRYLYFMFSDAVVTVSKDAVLPESWEVASLDIAYEYHPAWSVVQKNTSPYTIYLANDMIIHDLGVKSSGEHDVYYGKKEFMPSDVGEYEDTLSVLYYAGITVRRDFAAFNYDAEIAFNLLSSPRGQMKDKSLLLALPDSIVRLHPDGRVPDVLGGRVKWMPEVVYNAMRYSEGKDRRQDGLYIYTRPTFQVKSNVYKYWAEGVNKMEERLGRFAFVRDYSAYLRAKFPCTSYPISLVDNDDSEYPVGVLVSDCDLVIVNDYILDELRLYPLRACIEDEGLRARFLAMREKHLLPKIYCDFYLRHSSVEELAAFVGELEGWDGGGF